MFWRDFLLKNTSFGIMIPSTPPPTNLKSCLRRHCSEKKILHYIYIYILYIYVYIHTYIYIFKIHYIYIYIVQCRQRKLPLSLCTFPGYPQFPFDDCTGVAEHVWSSSWYVRVSWVDIPNREWLLEDTSLFSQFLGSVCKLKLFHTVSIVCHGSIFFTNHRRLHSTAGDGRRQPI